MHRDLKPNNIMVTRVDGRDFARVLDYGIAKSASASQSLTRSGAIIGTPEYLSPEQGSGETVDPRSDIYSLGVVLYEMLTGQLPFQANSAMGHVYAHLHHPPTSLTDHVPVPPEVEKLVMDCLAKDREARPQSMAELRKRLKAVLATLPAESIEDTLPSPPNVSVGREIATHGDPFTPAPTIEQRQSSGPTPRVAGGAALSDPGKGTILVHGADTAPDSTNRGGRAWIVAVLIATLVCGGVALLLAIDPFGAEGNQPVILGDGDPEPDPAPETENENGDGELVGVVDDPQPIDPVAETSSIVGSAIARSEVAAVGAANYAASRAESETPTNQGQVRR